MQDATPLVIEEITKRFKRSRRGEEAKGASRQVTALDRVSLQAPRGEIYGLLGPNGSGKSTLVRIISTLLLPDAGQARVFGLDVVRQPQPVRRLINRVSVEAAFFKKLSPAENLLYTARLYGLEAGEAMRRAREMLERIGFPKTRMHGPMEELSRGQQQKVAIVRGLFTAPALVLLDEPTTGLDPQSKREVRAFLRAFLADTGATILFTTHDMEEADRLCDRIGIMAEGRIVAEGRPDELKRRVQGEGGKPATLEDVFLRLTGKSMEEQDKPEVDD